jgi:type I site-specific restriction-modification system R (restriction) subunit
VASKSTAGALLTATIWKAFHQLQTYKLQIPDLFTYNEAMVVSDGLADRNDLDGQLFDTFARCQEIFAPDAGTGDQPGTRNSPSLSSSWGR